jgi:cytochrome bd ubiquinol oxidase subunit I
MDPVLLARLQFALTIGFHFIFPAITLGFAWLLVIIEGKAWRTREPAWIEAGKFFGKVFALTFALGVATGIVMEFQFGTNWASYSRFVGDVFGAPLAAEGIFGTDPLVLDSHGRGRGVDLGLLDHSRQLVATDPGGFHY